MPSREALLKLADEYKADAELLEHQAREFARLAAVARRNERVLREDAESGTNQHLHKRSQLSRVNVNKMMSPDHRLAISKGQKDDKFAKAIRAAKPKGFTQNGLAKAIGVKPSLLSMYRQGERPIPRKRAERIEELTGWPASDWSSIVSDA